MKMKWLPIAFLIVLFTGSCEEYEASSIKVYQMTPSNYEVLLYSNQHDIELEKDYIDAILELKLNYPEQLKDLSLTKTNVSDSNTTKSSIGTFPALVIQQDGKTIASITGAKHKDEILKVLQDTLYAKQP